jgi:hypothetical protein
MQTLEHVGEILEDDMNDSVGEWELV